METKRTQRQVKTSNKTNKAKKKVIWKMSVLKINCSGKQWFVT